MIREQRLRTTGRHFERANKRETGERKKEKGVGVGEGKKARRGGAPTPPPSLLFFPLLSFSLVRAFKMAAGRSLFSNHSPRKTACFAGYHSSTKRPPPHPHLSDTQSTRKVSCCEPSRRSSFCSHFANGCANVIHLLCN